MVGGTDNNGGTQHAETQRRILKSLDAAFGMTVDWRDGAETTPKKLNQKGRKLSKSNVKMRKIQR